MRRFFLYITITFSFGLVSYPVFSQDVARDVIRKVFYEPRVHKIIFFEFKGVGKYPFKMFDGLFAFIIPDSTFQRQFPGILEDIAYSWAKERKVFVRTFIATGQDTVFVRSGPIDDGTFKLLVRFDRISIANDKALLKFHTTTAVVDSNMLERYVKVVAHLRNEENEWKFDRIKISKFPCCENLSP